MSAIDDRFFILLAPCSLMLGALVQIAAAPLHSARAKGILATLFCLPAIAGVVAMMPLVQTGRAIELDLLQWDGSLTLIFHVDALSVLFAFMGTFLGALVLLYSIGYMAHDPAATRFYASMLIFIGGFVGLVSSANLLVMYLCWEVIGLCSFSLVGFWYTNREAVAGARKVLLMTHIAGYALLAAILVLYFRTGTDLWTSPAIARAFTAGIFLLMLAALVAKSVQVPLHTWIPEAMAAPTPVSSLLHAACYVTAGVYLAARMHSFGVWPAAWGAVLVWIGVITMALGVLYAMVQTDLKRMLAFSTVSQIGYMMMGLGIGTPLAIMAGLLHCFNHGFFKGGLFLNAGAVQHAAGTRNMDELGGLASRMPRTTLAWLVGVGNMAGIPLTSGFVSKWMLYTAALQAGWAVPATVAWIVSLGTVFLCVKSTSAVFLGLPTEKTIDAHEAPPTMQWAMAIMAVASIVLGIAPQLAVNYLLNPVLSALSLGAGLQVTWFGLFTGAGSFSTAGGLVLALISFLLGGVIYSVAYSARTVTLGTAIVGTGSGNAALAAGSGDIFTGGEPLSDRARLTASDFSRIFTQNWSEFFHWSNVDIVYLGIWRGMEAASRILDRAVSWMEKRAAALVVVAAAAGCVLFRFTGHPQLTAGEGSGSPVAPLLIAACTVAAVALVLSAFAHAASRKHVPAMLLISASTLAALLQDRIWLRLSLLELGALLTVVLVWQTARTQWARTTYLAVFLLSSFAMGAGQLLTSPAGRDWQQALLLSSILIKLAAVPTFFWLLSLADELPALVLGIIIAVVDMAAFGEFSAAVVSLHAPLASQSPMIYAAALTSLLAALLMLTQRSLKRLLVLSTVEDAGFLLFGAVCLQPLGLTGAWAAASTHALAKALLFACLSSPESDGALDGNPVALATRYPISAFGFLFGMLAMLGIPPTLGFIGRWRLYESALRIDPLLMAAFLVASAMALIAYLLALTRYWWGPAPAKKPYPHSPEPFILKSTIIALVLLLLAAGIYPPLLQMLPGGRP